jgi:hypothetical protein
LPIFGKKLAFFPQANAMSKLLRKLAAVRAKKLIFTPIFAPIFLAKICLKSKHWSLVWVLKIFSQKTVLLLTQKHFYLMPIINHNIGFQENGQFFLQKKVSFYLTGEIPSYYHCRKEC